MKYDEWILQLVVWAATNPLLNNLQPSEISELACKLAYLDSITKDKNHDNQSNNTRRNP